MKILFITGSIGFGGAEKMLCFVAESLQKRGHDIIVVNLKSAPMSESEKYNRKLSKEIEYYDVSNISRKKGLRRLKQIFAIKKIVKKEKVNIVVGFTFIPNLISYFVGKLCRISSIMSERGDPARTIGNSIVSKILLFFINRCSGGVFQTEGAQNFYGKRLKKRGVVIPNPIFVNEEITDIRKEVEERTVVSIGRFDNFQKRYDIMLKSFFEFSKTHPDYLLKLYGNGPDEKMIIKFIDEYNMIDKVKLMGVTKTPLKDISKEGIFLITSDYEGISNALLEAMAVGMPCVSTDHPPGGARLLIKHGENGLLAPTGDYKELARQLSRFADDVDFAKKCGSNAKSVITRFSPIKIIDMWEEYCLSFIK